MHHWEFVITIALTKKNYSNGLYAYSVCTCRLCVKLHLDCVIFSSWTYFISSLLLLLRSFAAVSRTMYLELRRTSSNRQPRPQSVWRHCRRQPPRQDQQQRVYVETQLIPHPTSSTCHQLSVSNSRRRRRLQYDICLYRLPTVLTLCRVAT